MEARRIAIGLTEAHRVTWIYVEAHRVSKNRKKWVREFVRAFTVELSFPGSRIWSVLQKTHLDFGRRVWHKRVITEANAEAYSFPQVHEGHCQLHLHILAMRKGRNCKVISGVHTRYNI